MKNLGYKLGLLLLFTTIVNFNVSAQGFLHASGKQIVDKNGNNYLIKGIGTGNWMIQEGYMMQTADFLPTMHEFRKKLVDTFGEDSTQLFYKAWLSNHFTKADVDSMAAWGFNTVRVAMHYKWFTLPIEKEPIKGQNTWLKTGFDVIDSLLSWCAANQMYLILDLHAAPGGQGKDAAISDYDSSKPSLWESDENKQKTVALWKKLAERYANEEWIGGYDLLNETNWTFPEGNNSQLRNFYGQIVDSIRSVDPNHLIFIEGNWFANDFSGLMPPFDDNMAYSFHKYWNLNNQSSIQWVLDLRSQYNVPIWLGETGENSNTWFTNMAHLAESSNIGWSAWPVKKNGINNVLKVNPPQSYLDLLNKWKNNQNIASSAAFDILMDYAKQHNIKNCEVHKDVIDAYIRQPHTTETLPYSTKTINDTLFATEYDLGRNNYAYFDKDTSDIHLVDNTFKAWNKGWKFRNDGVDIEECSDAITNGYSLAFTENGEWLQYTINNDSAASFTFNLRYASTKTTKFHLEVNGKIASSTFSVPATGAWSNWKTITFDEIIIPGGTVKIKIVFDTDHLNLNYFYFTHPQSVGSVGFKNLKSETDDFYNLIYIHLNKPPTLPDNDINSSDFQVIKNNGLTPIKFIKLDQSDNHTIRIYLENDIFLSDNLKVSYKGNSIVSGSQNLTQFTAAEVENQLQPFFNLSAKVEAENYAYNHGFQIEECSDIDGGKNLGYADKDDYVEYNIYVDKTGTYSMKFRYATPESDAQLLVLTRDSSKLHALKSVDLSYTGDWQIWKDKTTEIQLNKGKSRLRLMVRRSQFNLNWFQLDFLSSVKKRQIQEISVYPNPCSGSIHLKMEASKKREVEILNNLGQLVLKKKTYNKVLNINKLTNGIYWIRLISGNEIFHSKFIVSH